MIIPIGHEQTTVRRLPWVSLAILGLNLLVFALLGAASGSAGRDVGRRFNEVAQYWMERPYLTLPAAFVERLPPVNRRHLTELTQAMRSGSSRPDDVQVATEQRQLNALADAFVRSLEDHPFRKWGLVPGQMSVVSIFTSMFMHAGWLHLLGNLLLFYFTGPFVEDFYGRPLFAAVYLGSGVAAALTHVLAHPMSTAPLVGASGAVAGLMGVFLIRFSRLRVKFFYWFFLLFAGTFTAPAWIMLLLWLGQQLLYASVGLEMGVAYWAHVGGFAFGVVAAVGIRHWQVEERYIHPAIERELSITQHPGLDEGMDLLSRGEIAAGREALQQALAADPRNPDVNLALWQSHLQDQTPTAGGEYLARVVDHEVRSGEAFLALDHWRELVSATGKGAGPAVCWRLARLLEEQDPPAAREVLQQLAADPGAGELAPKAAARLEALGGPLAERAVPPPPPVALRAPAGAVAAEPHPVSHDPRGISAPEEEAAAGEDAAPAAWEPPPSPRRESGDWEVEECVPSRLQEDGVLLQGGGGATELLPYSEVLALAVAGITGERRYLLVDLVVAGTASEPERVVRWRSLSFDPRRLVGREDLPPLVAFRELLIRLVAAAGAPLVPASFDVRRDPFPTYGDDESYRAGVWPLLAVVASAHRPE